MKSILLSIITVCLNDRERLEDTIRSLADYYSDSHFEHVIVDGGSTDGSQCVLDAFEAVERVTVAVLPGSRIYDAMNYGVEVSKGAFLLFLNCGDRLIASPGDVMSWIDLSAKRCDANLLCLNSMLEDETGNRLVTPREFWPHRMPTSHQAMIFTRRFLSANPYRTDLDIAADYDLYLRLARGDVDYCMNPLPFTKIEGLGIASSQPLKSYSEYMKVAYERLSGGLRWWTILRIFCKGICVASVKFLLPRKWVDVVKKTIRL